MGSIQQSDYLAMLSRLEKNRVREVPDGAYEDEADLQFDIMAECTRRGWFCVRSRMDKPTTYGIGTPDLIIAADHGRTLWVEAKSKTGKTKPAQLAIAAILRKHGHEYALVRSFSEFLALVNQP